MVSQFQHSLLVLFSCTSRFEISFQKICAGGVQFKFSLTKTSKQKALLEMLSPLQCHSQVYDGTLGLICFKLGNIAS